ncbi:PadR family transcriptional regulator [Sulfolobales archaeon HS-7]|nr:PadR family transcriptional regulator [Sulfolobales archaeon HS-7]
MKRFNTGRVKRGSLKILILNAVKSGPVKSYEIMKSLENMTNGIYSPSPGAIYPVLKKLTDSGLIRVYEEDGTKYYVIAPKGEKELQEFKEEVKHLLTNKGEKGLILPKIFELGVLLYKNSRDIDEKKAKDIINILDDCKYKIEQLLKREISN